MGLGKTVKLNFDQYLKVLSRAGFGQDAQRLKSTLVGNGISLGGTFYQGPKSGDGKIVYITKNSDGGLHTMSRFQGSGVSDPSVNSIYHASGLYNSFTGTRFSGISYISARFINIFIAGLLGESELNGALPKFDKILLGGVIAARGCYDNNPRTVCNYSKLDTALVTIRTEKAKIRTAIARKRVAAERRAALAAKERVRLEKLRIARRIATLIAEAQKIWARAGQIIALAKQQDAGPGGINPDHLRKICARHKLILPTWRPSTLQEAVDYKNKAVRMIEEVLSHYSAYKSIEEKPGAVSCFVKEYSTPAPSCSGDESGYKGSETYATCNDIGISLIVKSESGGCNKPTRERSGWGGR